MSADEVAQEVRRRLDPRYDRLGRLVIKILVCSAVTFAISVWAGVSARSTAHRVEQQAHQIVQQNVRARYDDCLAGDEIRAALHEQARASARTTPVLFRLVPSLDTPEVRELVRRSRQQQLRTFQPRGLDGCRAYALRSVPPHQRSQYHVP